MQEYSQRYGDDYAYRRYGNHLQYGVERAGNCAAGKRDTEYTRIGQHIRKQVDKPVKTSESAGNLADYAFFVSARGKEYLYLRSKQDIKPFVAL